MIQAHVPTNVVQRDSDSVMVVLSSYLNLFLFFNLLIIFYFLLTTSLQKFTILLGILSLVCILTKLQGHNDGIQYLIKKINKVKTSLPLHDEPRFESSVEEKHI